MASPVQKASSGTTRFNRIRAGIVVSSLAVYAQLYLLQPLLSQLGADFSVSPATGSLVISAATVGMAVGLFGFAFYADAIDRKTLMLFSVIGSGLLSLLAALVSSFALLVALNLLKGIVVAGLASVALAYLSEEIEGAALGLAISFYLSGNTLGGMSGRVLGGLLGDAFNWQWASAGIGGMGLLLGYFFWRLLPPSRHFTPQSVSRAYKFRQVRLFLSDRLLLGIYTIAALLMGTFVSVYNYINFRLEAPPFNLPHYLIAFVFLMYLAGIAGSMVAGQWTDRRAPLQVLIINCGIFLAGLLGLFSANLWVFIAGLGVLTFGFFGCHTAAGRIVSEHTVSGTGTATALYWLFYYAGSSVLGTASGLVLSHGGWSIFVGVMMGLVAVAGAIALGRGRRTEAVT